MRAGRTGITSEVREEENHSPQRRRGHREESIETKLRDLRASVVNILRWGRDEMSPSQRPASDLLLHAPQHLHRIVRAARIFLMLEERVRLQAIGDTTSNPLDQLLQIAGRIAGLAEAKIDVAGGADLGRVELLGFGDT